MKMKEICEKTGLTDRTVRYYIEEALISPFYTENYIGRKSFDFSEQDAERLKDIATLRAFGFTVEEIKHLLDGVVECRQIVETVKKRTEESLDQNKRRLSVLASLDSLDSGDINVLAQKLSVSVTDVKSEKTAPRIAKRFFAFFKACAIFLAVWLPIVSAVFVLVYRLYTLGTPVIRPTFFICMLLCFLPSMATVLFFQNLKGGKRVLRTVFIGLCVVCLPLGVLFSSKSVIVCHHSYEAYRTSVQATCLHDGEEIVRCKDCGNFKTQTVSKLSHVPIVIYGSTPTCATPGTSDGSVCSLCSTVLVEQVPLSPTNDHVPIIDAPVDATCLNTGLTEGSHCSVCNATLVKQTIIPVTDEHTPIIDASVDATCLNTGLTEGSHCSVCNITLTEQAIIPAKGHSHSVQEIKQSCGTDGYLFYSCVCGDQYKTDIVRATNLHNFQPKADELGYICRECGLEVITHGTVDGSDPSEGETIKFYITGPEKSSNRTLVIYGNGDMPDFENGYDPAWISDYLRFEVRTIIIESGVTSVGNYAFFESCYSNVRELIIRSKHIRYDDNNYSFGGINIIFCKITYDYGEKNEK